MSDVLPPIEPETSGQETQFDVGHSDLGFKIAAVLVISLVLICFWWLFNPRTGDPKTKLKLLFTKFKSLFKNEWTWRLFMVLQITGIFGIVYLAIANDNNWHLFPYTNWNGELNWDFSNSSFWTDNHESWFVTAFLVVPFLMSKAIDWIFAAQRKISTTNSWKNN